MSQQQTDLEMCVAIAKAMGFRVFLADGKHGYARYNGSRVFSAGGAYIKCDRRREPRVVRIPDFPNDLNACHDMEKTLKPEKLWYMTAMLANIVPAKTPLAHATARQRCLAFIATINAGKSP